MKKQVKIIVNLVEWHVIPSMDVLPYYGGEYDLVRTCYYFLCIKLYITKLK
jgi:hypothetical protein